MEEEVMNLIANILGVILVLTGLIGFFSHDFMRMDLNPAHDILLIILGAISLYFGIKGTRFQARNMCRVLGVLFAILGVITLFAGTGVATAGNVNIPAAHVLKLVPGHLEYTTADGVRDLIVGIIGLIAGFLPRRQEVELEMKAREAQENLTGRRV